MLYNEGVLKPRTLQRSPRSSIRSTPPIFNENSYGHVVPQHCEWLRPLVCDHRRFLFPCCTVVLHFVSIFFLLPHQPSQVSFLSPPFLIATPAFLTLNIAAGSPWREFDGCERGDRQWYDWETLDGEYRRRELSTWVYSSQQSGDLGWSPQAGEYIVIGSARSAVTGRPAINLGVALTLTASSFARSRAALILILPFRRHTRYYQFRLLLCHRVVPTPTASRMKCAQ